jgi:acyl-CoA reductase-like NAD-dependent aldehyde dehydrogenase
MAVLQNAQERSLLQDPYSDERLRKIAESSIEYILCQRSLTFEQQEREIRNAVERLRLNFRERSQESLEWRIQILMRIETRFEARYKHWAAEAIEQVQRVADPRIASCLEKRPIQPAF